MRVAWRIRRDVMCCDDAGKVTVYGLYRKKKNLKNPYSVPFHFSGVI